MSENTPKAQTSPAASNSTPEFPPASDKGVKGQQEWRKRNSSFLMFLGRSHPWIPGILFIPLILALTYYGFSQEALSLVFRASLILLGAASWTLLEYALHRFSFHTTSDSNARTLNPIRWINKLTSGVHGLHHDRPQLPDLIVAPPALTFPTGLILLGVGWGLTGNLAIAGLFLSGVSVGYLWYEWVHFHTHCKRPRTWLGRYLAKYHMVHHFTDSGNYFGVTSPLWDIVFGTRPKKIQIKSPRQIARH